MTPLDAFVLISVLTLPPIACRMGYKRGVNDERARMKIAQAARVRGCQCGMQKPNG